MDNKEYKFEEGCMWEGYPWLISMDGECSDLDGGKPCKHSKNIRQDEYGGWNRLMWNCDVVVAFNEGEYNSTGVCLWCILEAVDSLGLRK